jgi:hypothetical protein
VLEVLARPFRTRQAAYDVLSMSVCRCGSICGASVSITEHFTKPHRQMGEVPRSSLDRMDCRTQQLSTRRPPAPVIYLLSLRSSRKTSQALLHYESWQWPMLIGVGFGTGRKCLGIISRRLVLCQFARSRRLELCLQTLLRRRRFATTSSRMTMAPSFAMEGPWSRRRFNKVTITQKTLLPTTISVIRPMPLPLPIRHLCRRLLIIIL